MGTRRIFSRGVKLGAWGQKRGPGIEPRWGHGGFAVRLQKSTTGCENNV